MPVLLALGRILQEFAILAIRVLPYFLIGAATAAALKVYGTSRCNGIIGRRATMLYAAAWFVFAIGAGMIFGALLHV
ncbi:MAG TPA: hypothetical protein VGK88_09565 [bacterium]|jgi:hypothetical protein